MTCVSSIVLPAGSHYASMWGIPDQYAGMTASMLQRSRAFVKFAGVEVTILTYEHRDNYDEVRDRLRGSGAMVDGMRLANMWEDLRSWKDDRLKAAVNTFQGEVPDGWEPLGKRGVATGPLIKELRRETGRHTQIDYFRADGTMLASDQRHGMDFKERSVILCDTSGQPLGSWRWVSRLYWLWLDSLPRDPVAWIIADSKTSANPLIQYDRPDVAKLHVVRGSHLKRVHGRPTNKLGRSRRAVMENLDAWDAVVFLTKTQRDDVASMMGPRHNLQVIPNSRNVPGELTNVKRPTGRGVMLSSLVERKRIQHAIRAMADARGRRLWWRGKLDVWGRGPLKRKLTLLIRKRNAPVKLRGYSTSAADAFTTASFSLLTSSAEAFANVLIESMGRGCIPISYDIPYGPSDIITHGVDGFLVPNGDIEALAAQIKSIVAASPAELAPMREAGHKRALDFSDEHVMQLWSDLMTSIAANRRA
jgi:poly(glycerol-phosphate) alpha-glucosyltransferase